MHLLILRSYLVDGNAYFYTAVDISRRLEYLNSSRTIVVGIGYPPGKRVYDFRRGPDLTPWAPEYDMPLNKEGKPRTDISFGEADEFLSWIESDVVPHVEGTLFSARDATSVRRALFGHSYGGIFTLNTLFTKPSLFDTYIAASPITWWNKDYLVNELEPRFRDRGERLASPVSLILARCERVCSVASSQPSPVRTLASGLLQRSSASSGRQPQTLHQIVSCHSCCRPMQV